MNVSSEEPLELVWLERLPLLKIQMGLMHHLRALRCILVDLTFLLHAFILCQECLWVNAIPVFHE